MEANIIIRPAQIADADALQRNCKTAATLEQVQAQLAWTTRERGPHVLEHLVAEVDGEVVGTVMTFPKGAHALQFANGWITQCRGRNPPVATVLRLDDWVVNARFHGKGVAVRLAEGSCRSPAYGASDRWSRHRRTRGLSDVWASSDSESGGGTHTEAGPPSIRRPRPVKPAHRHSVAALTTPEPSIRTVVSGIVD